MYKQILLLCLMSNFYIYLLCTWKGQHGVCIEFRRQLVRVSPILPCFGFWSLNCKNFYPLSLYVAISSIMEGSLNSGFWRRGKTTWCPKERWNILCCREAQEQHNLMTSEYPWNCPDSLYPILPKHMYVVRTAETDSLTSLVQTYSGVSSSEKRIRLVSNRVTLELASLCMKTKPWVHAMKQLWVLWSELEK